MDWKTEWFSKVPNSHWKLISNQKKFMDQLAIKFNIQEPKDWGKITAQQLHENGATSILNNYYSGSLFGCLQTVYKG